MKMQNKPAALRLKEIREDRLKLSMDAFAVHLGYKGASSYQRYENDKEYPDELPPKFVAKLAQFVVGRGTPEITADEVKSLTNKALADIVVHTEDGQVLLIEAKKNKLSENPQTPFVHNDPSILEIDVRGGMGGGGEALAVNHTDEFGNGFQTDDVRAKWGLPNDYVSGELHITQSSARIIEVQGDSMAPTLVSGDRVIIDTKDKRPTPPGVFALWDGIGVVVKRVEHIFGTENIKVISDNTRHEPFERHHEEINIIGRVVGLIRKM